MAPRAFLGLLLLALALIAPLSQVGAEEPANPSPQVQASASGRPRLLFSDEFEGSALDRQKWEVQVANGCQYGIPGWGNNERQWYTDLPANLRVGRGRLALRAVHDPQAVPPRQPFTSARIRTYGKFGVAPTAAYPTIRVAARMKVPQGLGLWPAFWMLPEEGSFASCSGCGRYGGWASSGEIDVAELANNATQLSGTIHYGGQWPSNAYAGGKHSLPDGRPFSDAFHVYSLEWERDEMRWYVDGQLYFTARSGQGNKEAGWYSLQPCTGEACATAPARRGNAPFDRKFHLILNLALGSEATPFTQVAPGVGVTEEQLRSALATPKALLVDWVRVWGIPA